MATRFTRTLATLALALLLVACGGTTPPAVPPPTSTPVPPTATPLPPTSTPLPPTSTPAPPAPTAAVSAGLPGTTVTVLTGHNSVSALAWSPDGSTLASGDADGTVRLWR